MSQQAAAFTLDTSAAEMQGAIVIDYKTLSKKGINNELSKDEELLTSGAINFAGQRLAIVAASSHAYALAAAQAVKVSTFGIKSNIKYMTGSEFFPFFETRKVERRIKLLLQR